MKDHTQWCRRCDEEIITRQGSFRLCSCDQNDIQRAILRGDFDSLLHVNKELPTLILEDLEELLKNG